MSLRNLPIRAQGASRPVEPTAIFNSLTLRGRIENLWSPQAEALELWHRRRQERDVTFEMNTGGGKTLVGLLAAQSLVNEARGKVVYLCPTLQLVEQVSKCASEMGLSVATYMRQAWTDQDVYSTCSGPCITSYQAVFNSKSIFATSQLRGIILDDAHVATSIIRSAFTLRISHSHRAFNDIVNVLRPYFIRAHYKDRLESAVQGEPNSILFVPGFIMVEKAAAISDILVRHDIKRERETMFPWLYLQDRLARCVAVLGANGFEVAPALPPVHHVAAFAEAERRLFLTATLPSPIEFTRFFGIPLREPVRPAGKLGAAQRLIVFLPGTSAEEQRATAEALISEKKACIIVPSGRAAESWETHVERFSSDAGEAALERFRAAAPPRHLLLVSRYDGIDLPGDACRVLILDGLPRGAFLVDRFLTETIRVRGVRASTTAARIVQAIGRIFRSNTDHGAVLLCGNDLQAWLKDPNHRTFMPALLQRQIEFGLELRRMVHEGHTTFEELLTALLAGGADWDRLYTMHVDSFQATSQKDADADLLDLFLIEHRAHRYLWDGNFAAASAAFNEAAEVADSDDDRLAAWLRHLEGMSRQLAGQDTEAASAYLRAANVRGELGRPPVKQGGLASSTEVQKSRQAELAAQALSRPEKYRKELDQIELFMDSPKDFSKIEEAICRLGRALGLDARRPDNEIKTGPDVIWIDQELAHGVAFDAKTGKSDGSQYRKKDDIGQFHDHISWLSKQYPDVKFEKYLVGPKGPVSAGSNPPEDLRLIELEALRSLVDRTRQLLDLVLTDDQDARRDVTVETALQALGLKWPRCLLGLESWLAVDLQSMPPEPDELGR